jgi:hypothetical protein
VGSLAEAFRKPYETARIIIEDVLAVAGPGTDCRDIFHTRRGYGARGRTRRFLHGTRRRQVASSAMASA